jgi:hypothetical protein
MPNPQIGSANPWFTLKLFRTYRVIAWTISMHRAIRMVNVVAQRHVRVQYWHRDLKNELLKLNIGKGKNVLSFQYAC